MVYFRICSFFMKKRKTKVWYVTSIQCRDFYWLNEYRCKRSIMFYNNIKKNFVFLECSKMFSKINS